MNTNRAIADGSPDGATNDTNASLRDRLERYFLSCSAAAGAGVALLGGAGTANADFIESIRTDASGGFIHSFAPGSTPFETTPHLVPNNFTGAYFEIKTGKISNVSAAGFTGAYFNLFNFGSINVESIVTNVATTQIATTTSNPGSPNNTLSHVQGFQLGGTIGPSSLFSNTSIYNNDGIRADSIDALATSSPYTQFLGFKFLNGATTDYGWIKLSWTPLGGGLYNTFVSAWAFDDKGVAIAAGDLGAAVPEPGSLALTALALGAAGLVGWRRRKAEIAQGTGEAPTPPTA